MSSSQNNYPYVNGNMSDSSDDNVISSDDDEEIPSKRARISSTSDVEYQHTASVDETEETDSLSEQETPSTTNETKLPMDMYSNVSQRIMEKMGFKVDKGLGVDGQGRIEPIQAFDQKGRRGLGMHGDSLDKAGDLFVPTMEHIQLRENAEWLINSDENLDYLSQDDMDSWLVVGNKKLTIDNETKFCDANILADMLKSKTVFDNQKGDEMRKARTRSNPFETIGRGVFLNRAAMKMANMDARMEFMFTNPIDEHGNSLIRKDDLLYFADVCAGPGGFSEYVLWRKGWMAKGFGFTLKAENDFKLDEFLAGHPETFDAYYGEKNDGNVYDPANITSLTKYVLEQTGTGVHFMMADGGFSVEGQENIQEILSKQLYLCQCLVALSIIREKGHFVVKLFDLFTSFSVGLIYLMYKCFQEICIFKPNTSRPANSERYLICKWKLPNTRVVEQYLFDINSAMFSNVNTSTDTLEIVSHDVLCGDEKFFTYIYESNNNLGQAQIVALKKIASYLKHPDLKEERQGTLCNDSLAYWKVPCHTRMNSKSTVDEMFQSLIGVWHKVKEFLLSKETKLEKHPEKPMVLSDVFHNISTWYFVPIETIEPKGKNVRTFFMSLGRCQVHMYTPTGNWVTVPQLSIEMSPKTLIYGEIVTELCGENRLQTTSYGLHIIDGIVLGGVDIRHLPLVERLELCEKFARSLKKPYRLQLNPVSISCKKLVPLSDFQKYFDRLSYRGLKNSNRRLGQPIRSMHGPDRFYVPRGLLFFNDLKPHLRKEFSRTHQKIYYFDTPKNHSFFPDELKDRNVVFASFKTTFAYRLLWPWEYITQVREDETAADESSNCFFRNDFKNLIDEKIKETNAKYAN